MLRRMRGDFRILAAPVLVASALATSQACAAGREIRIEQGASSFEFVDKRGDATKRITVYTYLPQELKASEARIVFLMHGHHRSAESYCKNWAKYADKYGFMVLAPLFDEEQWGHGQYSYASVVGKKGKVRKRSKWSFSVVEHLFDAVKEATGNETPQYFLFGFSEGGQFVDRLVLMLPEARYARAVIGTPGWYTMPTFDVKYPYGLRGSPATIASLRTSLGRKVVLLLGDEDTDPNHEELRKTDEAMAQGANRVERGKKFFRLAAAQASRLRTPFGWRMLFVRGAEHRPSQVSGAAAALLMEP
jgi:alpha-beta hydrolase superfamily lysophospholipase